MTHVEERLIEVGNRLARSIGHRLSSHCPKISPAVPCTCGSSALQAEALSDWEHLMHSIVKAAVKES